MFCLSMKEGIILFGHLFMLTKKTEVIIACIYKLLSAEDNSNIYTIFFSTSQFINTS